MSWFRRTRRFERQLLSTYQRQIEDYAIANVQDRLIDCIGIDACPLIDYYTQANI
jgi:hypothetical protein